MFSRFKSGNRVEFLRLCSTETCQCAKHCASDFGDVGVLHCVHQCVLGASRVALRLGRCVLFTKGCDQRDILQHLLSALLLLLTVVAGAASSDCSIEGVLLSSSPDDSLSGGGLLSCCVADCLWLAGSGVVVLNSSSATMCGLRVFLWFIGLIQYIGHPQPPDRSQHGCTVGVNRDPPVWLSIQAG